MLVGGDPIVGVEGKDKVVSNWVGVSISSLGWYPLTSGVYGGEENFGVEGNGDSSEAI